MADYRQETAGITSNVEEVFTTVTTTSPEVVTSSYVESSNPVVTSEFRNEVYRSNSPVLRSAEVYRSHSPVIRTEALRLSPVMRTSYVMEATPVMIPQMRAVQHACVCSCSGAVGRGFISANSYANRGLFLQSSLAQSNLATESIRATKSTSQATYGATQRSASQSAQKNVTQSQVSFGAESGNVSGYENKASSLANQNASAENANLKAKLAEAEANAAKYKNLYQDTAAQVDHLKNEVTDAKNGHTNDLAAKHDENQDLKLRLKEIDVLKSYLAKADEDNIKLCNVVNRQDEVSSDLRRQVQDCENHFKKALVEKETAIAHLNKVAADKSAEVAGLSNQVKNINAAIAAHEEKAKVSSKGHDNLKTAVTEKETHIVQLNTNVSQLNIQVTELNSTIALLEGKLELSNRNNNTLHTIIADREAAVAELSGSIAQYSAEINALNGEICALSMTVNEFENRFNITQRSLDVLHSVISEKEAMIIHLNRTISESYVEVNQHRSGVAQMSVASGYTTRSGVNAQSHLEAGQVNMKESKMLTEVETKLSLALKEKEDLGAVLNNKIATITQLSMRNANLEEQVSALEDLKSKVHAVVAENERLNNLIIEKSTTITEWSERYEQLERLYLAVKETTEQLDVVKRRFQQAVKDSEMATTVRRSVKTEVHQSRYSAGSEARTAGSPNKSPSDYAVSPYKVDSLI